MTDALAAPFSIAEALRLGWQKTKANVKPLLVVGVISAFLALLDRAFTAQGSTGGGVLAAVVEVAQVGVALAWTRIALRLVDGQPLYQRKPGELLADFFTFLLTSLLYGLAVAGGLVLLIVPGVFWGLQFAFAGFAVVDRAADPLDAFKESARLTNGHKWQLLAFALALLGVNLLGALALGVGLLFSIPVSAVAAASVFRKLQAVAPEHVAPQAPLVSPPHAPA